MSAFAEDGTVKRMRRPPKAKIVKMHKLLDEALGLWPEVRSWAKTHDERTWDMDLTWAIYRYAARPG